MNNRQPFRNIKPGTIFRLHGLTDYVDGGIESRAIVQREEFSMTQFSIDSGEEVSSYSIDGDSLITVIEGEIEVVTDNLSSSKIKGGNSLVVPANVEYSYASITSAKVMITIIK